MNHQIKHKFSRSRVHTYCTFVLLVLSALTPSPIFAQDTTQPNTTPPPNQTDQPTAPNANPTPPPAPPQVPQAYESPLATMMTFINAMNDARDAEEADNPKKLNEARKRAIASLDLSKVNSERGWKLATRLIGILNRLGEFQPWWLSNLNQTREYQITEEVYFPHIRFNSVLNTHEVTVEGKLVFTKQPDGRWLFSADSVAAIDDMYVAMEAMPILLGADESEYASELWLRNLMPASLKGPDRIFLTMEYWQWLCLLILIFIGVVIDHVVRLIVRVVASIIIRRQGGSAQDETLRVTVRPAGLLVMALFWLNVAWMLALPDLAYTIIMTSARIFAVLASVWFAWRATDLATEAALTKAEKTDTKIDDVVVPMIRTTLKIFIVIFGLIYGGQSLDIDITPMLASLTIAGAGFAFAAKDTLENFFGSATVLIDQPFTVGDWIVINDTEGTVEAIGFRSSRIRTFYNSLVTVPNANLIRSVVDNYGRRKYRRWKTTVGVQYDTPPEKLVAFVEGIREIVRMHPYTRKDYFQVYVNGFGPSSIDILVYIFHETPDWSTELRERERLILDMIRLADHIGVQFAFPTQTIHLFQEEHGQPHNPADAPSSMTDRRAMIDGIRKAQSLMKDQPWQNQTPGPVEFKHGPTQLDGDDESQIEDRTAGS